MCQYKIETRSDLNTLVYFDTIDMKRVGDERI